MPLLLVFGLLSLSGPLGACSEGLSEDGGRCALAAECVSDLCYGSTCMASDGDLDGDGLTNALEASLGTHADSSDSDGDGLPDAEEVGGDPSAPIDTDGDYVPGTNQRHDANESALSDADGDCIVDQLDQWDGEQEDDLERLASLSCRSLGVCAEDSATVSALCEEAGLDCDYGDVAGWEGTELSCDGQDNDCDGTIDEGLVYARADGSLAALGSPCQGLGACAGKVGVVECLSDGAVGCSTSARGSDGPSSDWVELPCNALDDDCDGVTDGLAIFHAPSGEALAVGEPCTSPGICQTHEGVVACVTGTMQAVCSTGPGGQADVSLDEVCNGADDDCDGEVDESLFYQPLGGAEPIVVGAPCGVAGTPCEAMTVGCLDGAPTCCQGTSPCVPWVEVVQPESCDGIDSDCDGQLDESLAMDALCAGEHGVCALNSGASGSCEIGPDDSMTLSCDFSEVAGWEADETLCDGLDNDCDGETDEGLSALVGESSIELGEPCQGVGACAGQMGVVICNGLYAVCDAMNGGSAEQCNGVDDDCDGAVDEGIVGDVMDTPEAVCLDQGVCAATASSTTCVAGQLVCGHLVDPLFEALEISCDAVDNDCDGWIDEGTEKLFSGVVTSAKSNHPVDRARWTLVEGEGGPYLFGGLHNRPLDGGDLGGRPLADLWRLDQASGEWVALAPAPAPRADHAVAWSDALEGLVVHGGFSMSVADSDAVEAPASQGMWLWRSQTNTWHTVVQVAEGDDETVLGRVGHSLSVLGDGRLLLHGGRDLGSDAVQTWIGELSETLLGDSLMVECVWSIAPHQAGARHGHTALYDAAEGRTLLVGGATGGMGGLVMSLADASETGWEPIGTLGKTQPSARTDAAIALGNGVLVVVGGHAVGAADGAPVGLDDAWRYDVTTDLWSSFSLPEGVPTLAGAFLLPNQGGTWRLGGGRSDAPVSWRHSWLLDVSTLSWGDGQPWPGLAPRTGATVVVDAMTSRTWVVGGSRMPGAYPLMDAHEWLSAEDQWQPLSADLTPVMGNFDVTRPALEGAAGVWSPVDEVVVLVGGRDVLTGKLSKALWALDPDAAATENPFSKLATYGDVPPGVRDPLFTVDSTSTGWLLGGFVDDELSSDAEPVPNVDDSPPLRVYSLDLTGYTWTLRWAQGLGVDGPVDAVRLLGGAGEGGLSVVAITATGGLSLWHFDSDASAFTQAPILGELSSIIDVASWSYDPQGHAVLATSVSSAGPETWRIDLTSGVLEVLPQVDAWPGKLVGVATGLHPWAGLLYVGGHDPGGYTTSTWSLAAQVCP